VVIREALDALDDDARRIILKLFSGDLAGAAVINIGRAIAHDQFFTRVLQLVKDPEGPSVAVRQMSVRARRAKNSARNAAHAAG